MDMNKFICYCFGLKSYRCIWIVLLDITVHWRVINGYGYLLLDTSFSLIIITGQVHLVLDNTMVLIFINGYFYF